MQTRAALLADCDEGEGLVGIIVVPPEFDPKAVGLGYQTDIDGIGAGFGIPIDHIQSDGGNLPKSVEGDLIGAGHDLAYRNGGIWIGRVVLREGAIGIDVGGNDLHDK